MQAWNELAISYQAAGMWQQAADAFLNSINLYTKLQQKMHRAFAIGDYYLCSMMVKDHKLRKTYGQLKEVSDEKLDLDVKPQELVIYQLVSYGVLSGDQERIVQAQAIVERSPILGNKRRKLNQILSNELTTEQVVELRNIFVDFVIGIHEQALSENKGSASSSSTDEIGSLVDLLAAEFDVVQSLLKLGHIVRVWLQVPQQALIIYQQAFEFAKRQKKFDDNNFGSSLDDEELQDDLRQQLS